MAGAALLITSLATCTHKERQISKSTRYVPDLQAYSALCERNYAQLMHLLPQGQVQKGLQRTLWLGQHEYRLQVVDNAPYTSVLQLDSINPRAWLAPKMRIVLYHDARMAEVCATQQISHPKGRYDYPNRHMFQQDEKYQANRLLADWLRLCRALGRLDKKAV